MTTIVHKTVGIKRIKQICNESGLTVEDAKIIDQILEEWKTLLGEDELKISVAIQKVGNNPRREKILEVLVLINIEFLIKSMNPDANC